MGKPAARLGDMTMHGGAIVAGFPMVLVGGMPAARIGDMHVCPMLNPGTPPPPHVGGPVALGSPTVLIGGMPAARMGDMLVCAGPPDTIAIGCPTVLIGEAGAGSASGGGAGGGAGSGSAGAGEEGTGGDAADLRIVEFAAAVVGTPTPAFSSVALAQAGAAMATTVFAGSVETFAGEGHWIEFQFVDSAGLPVSGVPYTFEAPDGKVSKGTLRQDGAVRRDGVDVGRGEVVLLDVWGADWSADAARVGEGVSMSASVAGFPEGTPAVFRVYQRDVRGADALLGTVEAKTQGGRVAAPWALGYAEDAPPVVAGASGVKGPRYSAPDYYFEVQVGPCQARSGPLVQRDYLVIRLANADGRPAANESYVVALPDGSVRAGRLDGSGKARLEDVPPGYCKVSFLNRPDAR